MPRRATHLLALPRVQLAVVEAPGLLENSRLLDTPEGGHVLCRAGEEQSASDIAFYLKGHSL